MSGTNSKQFLRSRIGIEGESLVIGIIALLILTAVLLINGNSFQFSLLAGAALGIVISPLRYLIQNRRG